MKFCARLAVVLAIARFAEPQTLPACAYSCVYDIDVFASDSTLCGNSDFTCQCTDEEYLSDRLCCLHEECSDSARDEAEEYWRTVCGYLDHTVPSGILCSTVASSSSDVQFTETSGPEPSSVTAESTILDGGISITETTTEDGSSSATTESATTNNIGSETAANSAFGTSSSRASDGSNSGTTKSSDTLVLKLGLGLGIALGVPLLVAAIYLVHLQRKKLKRQGPSDNSELQVSSYQAPQLQGYPPPSYPPPSHTAPGYPVLTSPPQVESQQEASDPYKYEHGGGMGGAGGNMNKHEVLGDMPPSSKMDTAIQDRILNIKEEVAWNRMQDASPHPW
ncbi:hypothetical protein EDB81DRAFT_877668 [Dactylonectria macrodidyma]|uniref:CFEM domain-containing protein n=1 Tax=Dactylonectria macrodidyma TaxID=307937 RepID=A0A9P9FLQ3_9HYPO|nr:hypothetical protein EDB81DRAFT_877668 [Dactylonectria macrodidyma]